MSLLVLTAADCDKVISTLQPEDLERLMAGVFESYTRAHDLPSTSEVVTPPRTKIQNEYYTGLFMPARLAPFGTSIKVVSVPSDASPARGLSATTLVLDEQTGAVRAVVNATRLTPLRNAAGSLLSTRLVGSKNPVSIVAFGAGMQIEANLDLHLRAFSSIRTCTIVNRAANDRLETLCARLSTAFPSVAFSGIGRNNSGPQTEAAQAQAVESALRNASIIICATSSTQPLFPSTWVRAGTHIILIGSYTPLMREVDKELILRACPKYSSRHDQMREPERGILLVDSREACAEEAGELIDAQLQSDDMVEIGELLISTRGSREVPPRDASNPSSGQDFTGEVTIFKSVGIAAQDVAIAAEIVSRAKALSPEIGVRIHQYGST